MNKNSQNFSIEDAKRLAATRQGQQILAMAQQTGGENLQKAAAAGDMEAVKAALGPLLASPQFRALVEELEGKHG
jgi:hypothetical protein